MNKVMQAFKKHFEVLSPYLDERTKRLYTAAIAQHFGHGGIKKASQVTQISQETTSKGLKELGDP